ncbi:MAG TPA: CPP1-like family protein, partial [Stenomitos sp.]
LRKRQEGKITVPEGVRRAEQVAEQSAKIALAKATEPPAWLQRLLDQPSVAEVLISAGVFTGLGTFAVLNPTPDSLAFLLALGVGFSMYWLNRKEQRLGRAFLITLSVLGIGFVLTSLLFQSVSAVAGLNQVTVTTLAILALFWLASSFLR